MQRGLLTDRIAPPQQARSRRTMERVLKTLLIMLDTRPFEEIAMAELARRAGAAITSIYARFEDKRALLLAAHQLHTEEIVAHIDRVLDPTRLKSASVARVIESALDQALNTFARRKNLHRAVLAARDHDVAVRAAEMSRHWSERVIVLLRGKMRGVDEKEAARRIDFALHAAMAVLRQRTIFASVEPSLFPLSDREMRSRLLAMVLAVLDAPVREAVMNKQEEA